MSSRITRPGSVAADSNVLLSAIAGKAARRVFEAADLTVVTTVQNIDEVREYIPTPLSREASSAGRSR